MNKPDDLDELPEMTDEILNEFQSVQNVDLHLGVPEVKKIDKNWWMKEYGPKPPGPGIYALDALIVFLSCAMFWLILNVWIWTFS